MNRPRRTVVAGLAGLVLASASAVAIAGPAHTGDRDRDGLPDRWERAHGLSVRVANAARDADRDGLTNRFELLAATSPRLADTDRDRVPDAAEDRDRDRLSNGQEQALGLNPARRDSDGDGKPDAREGAGVIASFSSDEGLLVVVGVDGTARTVSVDARTKIKASGRRVGTSALVAGARVREIDLARGSQVAKKIEVVSAAGSPVGERGAESHKLLRVELSGHVVSFDEGVLVVQPPVGEEIAILVDETTEIDNGGVEDLLSGAEIEKLEAEGQAAGLVAKEIELAEHGDEDEYDDTDEDDNEEEDAEDSEDPEDEDDR